jgi:hypothetical protein
MNAVRHGLLAQTVVLDGEEPEAFAALLGSFIEHFQPADRVELALVEEMAAANWRQHRCWAIETELMNQASSKLQSNVAVQRIAHGFTTPDPSSLSCTATKSGRAACSSVLSPTSARSGKITRQTNLIPISNMD